MSHFADGQTLRNAVALTTGKIKVFLLNEDVASASVSATGALFLMRSSRWKGRIAKNQVRYIREVDPRPQLVWVGCYRTLRAPALPPPLDWDPRRLTRGQVKHGSRRTVPQR